MIVTLGVSVLNNRGERSGPDVFLLLWCRLSIAGRLEKKQKFNNFSELGFGVMQRHGVTDGGSYIFLNLIAESFKSTTSYYNFLKSILFVILVWYMSVTILILTSKY